MKKLLCPSMMCADYRTLEKEIVALEEANVDIFHIDVMDGHYVPNFGMGLQDIECICKLATKPIDIHLMIENPENYVERFIKLGIDIVYIHPETTKHPASVLQLIRSNGARAGLAISPHITLEQIKPLLNLSDDLLVMTVNPGFAGQKYLGFVDEKIDDLLKQKGKYGYRIFIDGACSPEKIAILSEKGVDGFVLGTSALFGKNKSYLQLIKELRRN